MSNGGTENFLWSSQKSRADPDSRRVEPFALAGWVDGETGELESELGDRETIIMDDVKLWEALHEWSLQSGNKTKDAALSVISNEFRGDFAAVLDGRGRTSDGGRLLRAVNLNLAKFSAFLLPCLRCRWHHARQKIDHQDIWRVAGWQTWLSDAEKRSACFADFRWKNCEKATQPTNQYHRETKDRLLTSKQIQRHVKDSSWLESAFAIYIPLFENVMQNDFDSLQHGLIIHCYHICPTVRSP